MLSTLITSNGNFHFKRQCISVSSTCNIDINSNSHCNKHLQLKMIHDRSKHVLQTQSCCTFCYVYFSTDLPFRVLVSSEIPTKKGRKSEDSLDVCNICRSKKKTGHICCTNCKQWQQFKCAKINLQEAKETGGHFKCSKCKNQ